MCMYVESHVPIVGGKHMYSKSGSHERMLNHDKCIATNMSTLQNLLPSSCISCKQLWIPSVRALIWWSVRVRTWVCVWPLLSSVHCVRLAIHCVELHFSDVKLHCVDHFRCVWDLASLAAQSLNLFSSQRLLFGADSVLACTLYIIPWYHGINMWLAGITTVWTTLAVSETWQVWQRKVQRRFHASLCFFGADSVLACTLYITPWYHVINRWLAGITLKRRCCVGAHSI